MTNSTFRPLFLALLGLVLTGIPAQAETVTVTNAVVRNISFTPATYTISNSNLNAAVSGGSLGNVNVQANDAYKVSVTSANAGNFSNGTETMAYTLSYNGGTAAALTVLPQDVETQATYLVAASQAAGVDRAITINIAEGQRLGKPAGNYTDNVTFTISAP